MIINFLKGMSNFIEQYQIDEKLCKKIIEHFEESPFKSPGCFGGKNTVQTNIKDSTDMLLEGCFFQKYMLEFEKCVEEYKKKYIYCDIGHAQWSVFPYVNVQRYLPGEGYHVLHCERVKGHNESSRRHLVFMTYLNDVTDDGETFFYYQNLKIKPKTGLTLIWPADWTHTHCGITSNTQTKYIVTGWMSYTPHEPFYILPM